MSQDIPGAIPSAARSNATDTPIPRSLIPPAIRVLLIDDEAGITALCRWILEESGGYLVREENRPLQGLATARAFRPHLILLDRRMPGRSGDELAADFAADSELGRVPIVFLTGDTTAAAACAPHPVLPKPLRAAVLLATLAAAVRAPGS